MLSLIRHSTGQDGTVQYSTVQDSTVQREKWNDYEKKGVQIVEDIVGCSHDKLH